MIDNSVACSLQPVGKRLGQCRNGEIFPTLKTERIDHKTDSSRKLAKAAVSDYIEC
jgi:hypothetical protein